MCVFFLFDHLPATITVPTTDEEGIEGFFSYSFSSHMRLIWREKWKGFDELSNKYTARYTHKHTHTRTHIPTYS